MLTDYRLYKSIESAIASRAQGSDGMPRMDTIEYATAVVDETLKRTVGRVWYGTYADNVKMSTTATSVPQSTMVSPR
jgi:1-acylglycerone phosphate reductase